MSNSATAPDCPADDPPAIVDDILSKPTIASDPNLASRLYELKDRAPAPTSPIEARDAFVLELGQLLFQYKQQTVMNLLNLNFPIYDNLQDFASNKQGPWAPPLEIRPVVRGAKWQLLGKQIGLPIGVPASVLTMNSRWISNHSQNGFNVLTYKTVRTKERAPHGVPNWVFLDSPLEPITPGHIDQTGHVPGMIANGSLASWPHSPYQFSTANSFGVPSGPPRQWMPDIEQTLRLLADDQLLIVSVMGRFEELRGNDLAKDFVRAARLAAKAGASAVELNLSCPNGIIGGHALPPVYRHPDQFLRIIESVRSRLDQTVALVIKLGYLHADELEPTLKSVLSIIDGIAGINTVQMPVKDSAGRSTFPGRDEAGVAGYVLRELSFDFVRNLSELRKRLGMTFDIIGIGGVLTPSDALRLYEAGASAVQSASGAFFNPYLARDIAERIGDSFPRHKLVDFVDVGVQEEKVLDALRLSGPMTVPDLSVRIHQPPSVTRRVVERLVGRGALYPSGSADLRSERYALE